MKRKADPEHLEIGGSFVPRGFRQDVRLKISETYTGDDTTIPIRVIRAQEPGPTVFVSAAIHGDEINGTGIIHELMFGEGLEIKRGSLILIPVVNVFGFENHERYLPDRRDLNRSFPGSAGGSLAARIADTLMREIVAKCDFGLDLHSAAFQRTNYPNVRADLKNAAVRKLAEAFGCALIVDGKGPEGSFRREACRAGCPTVILEAGEPWKIEPAVLEIGLRGVRNVLLSLEMLDGERSVPPVLARIKRTAWVRASVGGILKFHVGPGEIVTKDQPIATNYSILGAEQNVLLSPTDGIVLSVATLPAVKPGEPVCHIAVPTRRVASIRAALQKAQKSAKTREDSRPVVDIIEP